MADLSRMPPSRFRVVERDRRLVVIDTLAVPIATTDAVPPPGRLALPRQSKFDGSAELTTHRFYDDKAPRTIRLDPGSAAAIGRLKLAVLAAAFVVLVLAVAYPWLLLPLFFLANGAVRTPARQAATRWLDTVAREAG